MRVLIVEDEIPAANRLRKMLLELNPDMQFMETLDAVSSTVEFLQKGVHPDLMFLDIHLADGDSFEIFKLLEVNIPIIFTTAFDEYAVQAFKVNAIDYLLKPIKSHELEEALQRFKKRRAAGFDWKNFFKFIETQSYDKRFLIRIGQQLKLIDIKEAAYFYREDRITFLVNFAGRRYPVDYSLEALEECIHPDHFFRINRKMIINLKAIKTMHGTSKSRVKLELEPKHEEETVVSTDRSPHFKRWLEGVK